MIYSNLTVTISGGESRVNEKIILYRGDRDIQVSFEIVQASFRFGKGENVINTRKAGYGQLIIDKPDDTYTFSEMTPCDDGLVVFTITSDMIDELTEVGLYSMQIRLFDETGQSRITLPPINDAIEVREPIATEDISEIGEVGVATVGYAVLNGGEETEDVFDDDGMYKIMYWNTGDIITEGRLNRTEDAIYETNYKVENIVIPDTSDFITESEVEAKGYLTEHQSLTDYATKAEIPTNISQLTNDSGYLTSIPSEYVTDTELDAKGYLTEHQSLTDYATKSYVDEAINALRTELMALINSGGNNSSEVWAHADDDYTDATTNNDITKVYVELTSSNYTTRPKEVLQYYPNCEELYLFDDGTVTTLTNMYNGEANGVLEASTVEFMDGYFESLTDFSYVFTGQTKLVTVRNIPSGVYSVKEAFNGCTSLTAAPLIPDKVTNMQNTFSGCTSLATVQNISSSKLSDLRGAFKNCSALTETPVINITASSTNMNGIFNGCVNLTTVKSMTITNPNLTGAFSWCSKIDRIENFPVQFPAPTSGTTYIFGGGTTKYSVSSVTFSGTRTTSFDMGLFGLNFTESQIKDYVNNHLGNVSGQTLTLGSTYLGYLTAEEISAAQAKGWTLA